MAEQDLRGGRVGRRRVHKQDRPAIAPPSHPCNKFPMAAAIATPCAPLIIISPQPSRPHPLLDHSCTVCTPAFHAAYQPFHEFLGGGS